MADNDLEKVILRDLCDVCKVRFTENAYIISVKDLERVVLECKAKRDSLDGNHTPCFVCLDLFTSKLLESLVADVVAQFKVDPFDVQQFNLALTYPVTCMIREHLVKSALTDRTFQSDTFMSIREAWKLLFAKKLEAELKMQYHTAAADFMISASICCDEQDRADCALLEKVYPTLWSKGLHGKSRKRSKDSSNSIPGDISRNAVPALLEGLKTCQATLSDLNFTTISSTLTTSFQFTRDPLFIGGRYCKYSRFLHQTPWILDGERCTETSVEEIIDDLLLRSQRQCQSTNGLVSKFTASGREDSDVRTLGEGRPFAMQILNPRRKRFSKEDMEGLQSAINSKTNDLQVLRLQVVRESQFNTLKLGEEEKTKCYSALCYSNTVLTQEQLDKLCCASISPLEIKQWTPLRVLHRRALMQRVRSIIFMKAFLVNEYQFRLFLKTQAGTYVKEFVHGDFGRTAPCLGDILGVELDILELDVESVDLDWP